MAQASGNPQGRMAYFNPMKRGMSAGGGSGGGNTGQLAGEDASTDPPGYVRLWVSIKEFWGRPWDSIKEFWGRLWDSIKEFWGPLWDSIKEFWGPLWDSIKEFWGRLVGIFVQLIRSAGRHFWCTLLNVCLLFLYILICGALFHWRQEVAEVNSKPKPYSGSRSLTDGVYWATTTVTTVGFGDIFPQTTEGKIGTVLVLLIGMSLMTIISHTLNEAWTRVEEFIIDALFHFCPNNIFVRFLHDRESDNRGKKVTLRWVLALLYSVVCMFLGMAIFKRCEHMKPLEAIYASIIAQSTLGYGDKPFTSKHGRRFATFWLVLSTSALNRMFELQVEIRLHWRSKKLMAKEVLIVELNANNICQNIDTRKLEFFMHKLKSAKKIDELDIKELEDQYVKLWPNPNQEI